MATFNYAKAADTALRLLVKFGNQLTYTRNVATLDPVTGITTHEATTANLQSVVLVARSTAVNAIEGITDDFIRDAIITGKFRYILAAAKGTTFAPKAEDFVKIGTEVFKLVGCSPLNPAGVGILYKIGAVLIGDEQTVPPGENTWASFTDTTWEELSNVTWGQLT